VREEFPGTGAEACGPKTPTARSRGKSLRRHVDIAKKSSGSGRELSSAHFDGGVFHTKNARRLGQGKTLLGKVEGSITGGELTRGGGGGGGATNCELSQGIYN